jgi:hypothetical protein
MTKSTGTYRPRVYGLNWRDHVLPEPNSGCWLWERTVDPRGYGRLRRGGKTVFVHRLAWADTYGPIPDDLIICHRCDNPGCANPDHLFIGTHADNVADKVGKGRQYRFGQTHCIRGHEFTPENTKLRKGGRTCRTCANAWQNAYYYARYKALRQQQTLDRRENVT